MELSSVYREWGIASLVSSAVSKYTSPLYRRTDMVPVASRVMGSNAARADVVARSSQYPWYIWTLITFDSWSKNSLARRSSMNCNRYS